MKNKTKKILVASSIALLGMSGTAFAEDNQTSIGDQIVQDDNQITPDNTLLYKFDRFGDWTKLQFAKLGGDDTYDRVENEVLQERLAELKLVNEENRLELQEDIKSQINDRKVRKEERISELKKQIVERKQNKLSINETSIVDDKEYNNLLSEIVKVETEILNDDDDIRKKLKEVEQYREVELTKLKEKFEKQEFDARELNRDSDKFIKNNKEMFEKYGSIIEKFDGDTFKITTDKREIVGEVIGDRVNFRDSSGSNDYDYEIQVKSESEVKDMIRDGDYDMDKINENIEAPLDLKTKIAYNVMKYN